MSRQPESSESRHARDTAAPGRPASFRLPLMIFGLALITRLAAAILVDQYVTRADRQFLIEGDANGYWELAGHIAAGRDYAIHTPPRYVLRTPGFPLLLAASIRLFGDSPAGRHDWCWRSWALCAVWRPGCWDAVCWGTRWRCWPPRGWP